MTDLLANYRAAGPGHDEMLQSTGAAREAWAQMADLAGLSDGRKLAERARDVATLVDDNGVRQGAGPEERPWRLDPLPVLFDEQEWATVEKGLQQRSVLLDHLLADVYADATLLAGGQLPPALVLGHPGFLRAVDGVRNPGPHQLFMLGIDIARNADGFWQVIADRAGAPIGMGYAMQDRRIIAEALFGLYRHARIRRIGPFFQAMRRAIADVAPAGAEAAPRTVLLTPGVASRASFDQAYLATMLGYPLVEGEDLTVEDGRVWMRSLDKLEPVDVILRHVPAHLCDPLDLRGDSQFGVPGLVEAARNGAVTIANPLGSGVLENPGLLTYLPRLCRTVLGEELLIPSVVTYWCGERSMCSHVIANLDRLVLRDTQPGGRIIRGWQLTIAERADLAAQIASEPHLWVGQERVEPSTTPTVTGTDLEARPTQLRTFAVASSEGYRVMSGGLARIAPIGGDAVDLATTDLAKDVWVLSSTPYSSSDPWVAEDAGPAPDRLPTSISPGAAEDLFWFGRRLEQAEHVTRLVRAVSDRWNDFSAAAGNAAYGEGASPSDGVLALVALTEALAEVLGAGTLTEHLLETRSESSVSHAVRGLSRRAYSVRDQLSGDIWSALSVIERALARQRGRLVADGESEASDLGPVTARVLDGVLAVCGILAESMERDVGWYLLETGRRLERAQRLVRLLAATITTARAAAVDSLVLETVLIANQSVITYKRRYQARASVGTVLDLLLMDPNNPRSLRYQLEVLGEVLAKVPSGSRSTATRDMLLADLTDLLDEVNTAQIAASADDGGRAELAEMLSSIGWRLGELGEEIAKVHFSHPVPTAWIDASGSYAAAGSGASGAGGAGQAGGAGGAGQAGSAGGAAGAEADVTGLEAGDRGGAKGSGRAVGGTGRDGAGPGRDARRTR